MTRRKAQPYLVYEHFDALHPHIHIVTTNIQRDGQRILLYNIRKNQSERRARKSKSTTTWCTGYDTKPAKFWRTYS